MPELTATPRSAGEADFRREFYRRWGRENCIVSGSTRRAEYGLFRQTLSIKCVARGAETYFVDGRRFTVRDDSYLVLNEGRTYASLLEAREPAYSFAIFFRPGLAREVAAALRDSPTRMLDEPANRQAPVEFAENLRSHDRTVSPVVRFIQREIARGTRDEHWLEEQCQFLVERLVRAHDDDAAQARNRLAGMRPANRAEILRRLGWATDYMHGHLGERIGLREIAAAARLSRFHFLRLFQIVHGKTPAEYLRSLRLRRALTLIESHRLDAREVAARTGMSRISLWRGLVEHCGGGIRAARSRAAGAGFLASDQRPTGS